MMRQAQERMAALPPPPQPLAELPAPAPGSAGDPLQRARALARDDPKVVANVVKGWVTRDE
jgi:flagellar biosynthesis/type III secretory pathway M-ring protein FliF/YscJ